MAGYALTDLCAKSRTLRKLAGGAYALAAPAADGPPQLDRTRMAATVVISTPDVDRSGDVVVTRGIRTGSHKANPVVLFEHGEKGYALPIGKAEDDSGNYTVVLQPDRAVATTYFSQSSRDAEAVYALIDEGILRGASVGFRPLKAEYMPGSDPENPSLYLEEIELVEYSHVVIPDNAGALKIRVEKGLGSGLTPELRRALAMAADLAPRPPVPVTDPRVRVKVLDASGHEHGADGKFGSGGGGGGGPAAAKPAAGGAGKPGKAKAPAAVHPFPEIGEKIGASLVSPLKTAMAAVKQGKLTPEAAGKRIAAAAGAARESATASLRAVFDRVRARVEQEHGPDATASPEWGAVKEAFRRGQQDLHADIDYAAGGAKAAVAALAKHGTPGGSDQTAYRGVDGLPHTHREVIDRIMDAFEALQAAHPRTDGTTKAFADYLTKTGGPARESTNMATYAGKGSKAFDPDADDADGYGAMDDTGAVDKAAPDDGLGLDDLPPNPDAAADLAGDHPEPDADDAAAPADDRPPGAQALESVYTQMMAVGAELGNQMRRQENPEVRAHLEAVAQQIEDAAGAAAELYADQYPDLDPLDDAGGADDAPAEDAADADAPAAKAAKKGKKAWEGDGPASRRLALRMAAWRTKRLAEDRRAKRLSRSRLERLKAAADMYEEMAADDGMTASKRAACKYHANALRDLYTAGGGTGDEDEAAQMDKHARELMAKKLADMEGTVAKLTRQLRLARTGR